MAQHIEMPFTPFNERMFLVSGFLPNFAIMDLGVYPRTSALNRGIVGSQNSNKDPKDAANGTR